MQDGVLAAGVPEWRQVVLVNGVQRPVASMSWAGELASDLPDAVAGVSGVSARTGSISWAPLESVESRPPSPWVRSGGWPPRPGDRVEIWVGDADTSWKVFTGRIDSSEGSLNDLSSKIIDDSDDFDRLVSLPAVAELMPGPYTKGGPIPKNFAPTLLTPWAIAYRCMREAGYALDVPSYSAGSRLLEVEMQGATYASRGTLQRAAGSVSPTLAWADGYTFLSGGSLRYVPVRNTPPASSGLRVWLRWHLGEATATVVFDDDRSILFRATRNSTGGTITLATQVRDGGPSGTLVGQSTNYIGASPGYESPWIEIFCLPGDDTLRVVTPRTAVSPGAPNGSVAQTFPVPATFNGGVPVDYVDTSGTVTALQVGTMALPTWEGQSAAVGAGRVRAWGQGPVVAMRSSRTIENEKARDVLEGIGKATLTAMWLDETGTMQWAPSNQLWLQTPSLTVTTEQDIFALGWMESLQATRRQVVVKYLDAALTLSGGYATLLYQPSNTTEVTAGGQLEEFIGPPTEEEWFDLDEDVVEARVGVTSFNRGSGSYWGGVYQPDPDVDSWSWVTSGLDFSLSPVGLRTWKMLHSNTSSRTHSLMTAPAGTGILSKWRAVPLPILRGRGKVSFAEDVVRSSADGPDWAPTLEHDIAHWGRATDAQRIADFLMERLSEPLITLTNLEIAYDPRIQLGDVITVDSLSFAGFSVDVLVIGKNESHGGGASLSLTVRVINVRTVHVTYADFEAAYAGDTYAALESAWAGATFTDFEADPLGAAN